MEPLGYSVLLAFRLDELGTLVGRKVVTLNAET